MKLEGDCLLALGVALTLGMAVPTLLWQCVGDILDKNRRVVGVVVKSKLSRLSGDRLKNAQFGSVMGIGGGHVDLKTEVITVVGVVGKELSRKWAFLLWTYLCL